MTRFLTTFVALLAFSIPSISSSLVTAQTQGGSPMRDVIIEEDTDYFGFDISDPTPDFLRSMPASLYRSE